MEFFCSLFQSFCIFSIYLIVIFSILSFSYCILLLMNWWKENTEIDLEVGRGYLCNNLQIIKIIKISRLFRTVTYEVIDSDDSCFHGRSGDIGKYSYDRMLKYISCPITNNEVGLNRLRSHRW